MNLLHNSAKFTSCGVITIRIDDEKIIIEDTGCGIDPLFSPRLFEPYIISYLAEIVGSEVDIIS